MQRLLHDAKVVKAFNIVGNENMFRPNFEIPRNVHLGQLRGCKIEGGRNSGRFWVGGC